MTTSPPWFPCVITASECRARTIARLTADPCFITFCDAARRGPRNQSIAVDTDSDVVMEGLREHFPACLINRPESCAPDDVPMNDILEHDTAQVQADFFLADRTRPIPCSRPETISRAIRMFWRLPEL